MTTTMNTAHQIAKKFSDDGQIFTNKESVDINDILGEEAKKVSFLDHDSREHRDPNGIKLVERYEFQDGSAIIVSGDGWDIEGFERFCPES